MRLGNLTLAPAAAVVNAVSLSQTPGGAGALLLNGGAVSGGVATFPIARRVLITSAADDHLRTFVVTGTDRTGKVITETLAGPTTNVSTLNDYLTVTSVTVDAATAGAIQVGTGGILSSQWIPAGRIDTQQHSVAVIQSGVANWTVEHTLESPWTPGHGVQPPGGVPAFYLTPFPHPVLAAQSTSKQDVYTFPIAAFRLTINSYTAGASLKFEWAPGYAGR